MISFENLTPTEIMHAKNKEGAKIVIATSEKYAKEEKAIEIAKIAIKKGLDNEFISELTGLTLEQIEELRNELKQ